MHKDIKVLLGQVGLEGRDLQVYLNCLQHKNGLFAQEIVKTTRIARSTIDITLQHLLRLGFLNSIKVGRRRRFCALAPEMLLFRQRQLADNLAQIIPILAKMGGEKKETEVLYFEGEQGFRQVHDDILLQTKFATGIKKDILAFSSGTDFLRLYPNIQKLFITKRIKNGSWYKGITHRSVEKIPEWSNDRKFLRQIKYIGDEAFSFRSDIQIYADSVMLYSTTPPIGGVIIRNEKIADSMRGLFNLMWGFLLE